MEYWSLLRNFFRLRGNGKKSRSEIRRIQERRLRELLAHAYEHSAYYRRTFEKAGITGEQLKTIPVAQLPTIDKRTLLEHFHELVTDPGLDQEALRRFDEGEKGRQGLFQGKYHVVHSSGSTGKPGYFVYDEKAWNEMLLGIIRGALWGMSAWEIGKLLLGGPRIVYIAATDGRYGGAMAVGDGIDGLHAKQLFLDVKTPLAEWIAQIRTFRPNIVIGYPSAIKILAELVMEGRVEVNIQRVISCGEPLSVSLRQFLEKAFRADIINFYGASESLALGVETGDENGMILFDDMNYIEVEDGYFYLTSLYNYVQPLIRYRISDKLVLKEALENDAYPFTRTEILLSRNEDLLWFEDENGQRDFLHPLAVEGFCIEGLLDYQFRQLKKDSFEMIAQAADDKSKVVIYTEMFRQMTEILREKRMEYVQFHLRFEDQIMPDLNTGKKPLIVRA